MDTYDINRTLNKIILGGVLFGLSLGIVGLNNYLKGSIDRDNKQNLCYTIFENVIQSRLALSSQDTPENNAEIEKLKKIEPELFVLCNTPNLLNDYGLECTTFRDAWRKAGKPELPDYIICGESK